MATHQTFTRPPSRFTIQMEVSRNSKVIKTVKTFQKKTVVGRGSKCDMHIDDDGISRTHLAVEIIDQQVFLTDLGSSNGTIIDGKKLVPNQRVLYNTFFLPVALGPHITIIFSEV